MSTHRKAMNGMAGVALAGALLLVGVVPRSAAAQDTHPGWLPWIGCWEAMGEIEDESLLCIRPTADRGVEMLTVMNAKVLSQVTVLADGMEHPSSREGCEGSERAQFSDDGRRIYLHSEYLCEGGVQRNTSGLMSMNTPYEWLDVKAAEVSGQEVAWGQRYRLASKKRTEAEGFEDLLMADRAMSVSAARAAASAEIEIEDVMDAIAHVSPKAVEAWVAERGEGFDLNADELVRMADSGVPGNVVDVMVAVSYPRLFTLGRTGEADAMLPDEEFADEYDRYAARQYYDPFYFSPFYSPYGRYGYGYGYSGYYGYGYGGYGYGYGGYYGGYTPIYVVPAPRDTGGHGRVVKGRGYTRGSGSSGTTGRTATGRGRTGGSSGASASGGSGRSSGSASTGSSSTGRTAKRRGGG